MLFAINSIGGMTNMPRSNSNLLNGLPVMIGSMSEVNIDAVAIDLGCQRSSDGITDQTALNDQIVVSVERCCEIWSWSVATTIGIASNDGVENG